MSAHAPKTAALIAYAEELLSDAGRARVETHLAGCETCRRELAAIRAYDRVADEIREAAPPRIDFERMELALAREARAVAAGGGSDRRVDRGLALVGVVFAAAAIALVFLWPREQAPIARPEPAPRPAPSPEPSLAAESPRLDARATLTAGTVERVEGAAPVAIAVGDALAEGARVRTGAGALLHARLSEGTGIAVEGDTELGLGRLRQDGVELALARGVVSSTVAPLASRSTFVILAAEHRVEVRGTRFVVACGDVLEVAVDEGVVAVIDPDGGETVLLAPARWSSAGGSPSRAPAAPRGLASASLAWPILELADPRMARWSIDGTDVESAEPLRMRLRAGEHSLSAWDLRGRLYTMQLRMLDTGMVLDPAALVPEAPRVREGHLEQSEIMAVVNRGRRHLQQCYDTALRRRPDLRPSLRIRVTVDHVGGVDRVQILDQSPRVPELETCLANRVQAWSFPPPGGRLTFEAPFTFTARE